MVIYAPVPTPALRRRGAPVLTSSALFRYQPRRMTLNAVTGQIGTLTRAATGTAVDGLGTTWTAQHSMPRWEARDWSGTGVRDTMGLRLAADDLAWPVNFAPGEGALYIEAAEVATLSAGGGLVYLGNDAQTGARLKVDATGGYYRAVLTDGTTTETVTLASATPDVDDVFRLKVDVQVSGTDFRCRLQIDRLRVTGATGEESTAWSGWITTPTAWGATAKLRVNRAGSAGTQGSTWLRDVAWFPEIRTFAECAWL